MGKYKITLLLLSIFLFIFLVSLIIGQHMRSVNNTKNIDYYTPNYYQNHGCKKYDDFNFKNDGKCTFDFMFGKGGAKNMMGYGNYAMNGGYLFGSLFPLIWIVLLIDLILVGVWLWQQIGKNKKQ